MVGKIGDIKGLRWGEGDNLKYFKNLMGFMELVVSNFDEVITPWTFMTRDIENLGHNGTNLFHENSSTQFLCSSKKDPPLRNVPPKRSRKTIKSIGEMTKVKYDLLIE